MTEPLDDLRLTGPRVRRLGRAHRRGIWTVTALLLLVTATRIAEVLVVAALVGRVLDGRPAALAAPLVSIAALTVARVGLMYASSVAGARVGSDVRAALRTRLYSALLTLGPGYLAARRTGDVEAAVGGGVDGLGEYYAGFVPLALASVGTMAVVVTWVAVLDPPTALVLLGCALLVPLAPIVTARAFGATGARFAASVGRLSAEYLDAIQGVLTLKAFGAGPRWAQRLRSESEELAADTTSLAGLATMHVGFVSLGIAGGTVLSVALATLRTTHHAVAGSALVAILLLARECLRPLAELQAAFPSAYTAVSRFGSVLAILDAEAPLTAGAAPFECTAAPEVCFDGVSFGYEGSHALALTDVSFTIAPGETVAIVGPSGAGKTTVVTLMLRFLEPLSGHIRIDGRDTSTVAPDDLRAAIAVSFQDPYLFHTSVAANLRLGRPGATAAEIDAVARATSASGFIDALPSGYDTAVGERGGRLSGGERQRIALARALLVDAPILVLDEPTSSVDAVSESLISDALDHLGRGRTTIIIAHRLSTIARADRIIVLDAGRVVETGTPEQLRDGGGVFARLVDAS